MRPLSQWSQRENHKEIWSLWCLAKPLSVLFITVLQCPEQGLAHKSCSVNVDLQPETSQPSLVTCNLKHHIDVPRLLICFLNGDWPDPFCFFNYAWWQCNTSILTVDGKPVGWFLFSKSVLTAYHRAALFWCCSKYWRYSQNRPKSLPSWSLYSYRRLEGTDSKQNKYEVCMYVIWWQLLRRGTRQARGQGRQGRGGKEESEH